jgi:hypothetical protein
MGKGAIYDDRYLPPNQRKKMVCGIPPLFFDSLQNRSADVQLYKKEQDIQSILNNIRKCSGWESFPKDMPESLHGPDMLGGALIASTTLTEILKFAGDGATPADLCANLPKHIPHTCHNKDRRARVTDIKHARQRVREANLRRRRDTYRSGLDPAYPISINDDGDAIGFDDDGDAFGDPQVIDETSRTINSGSSTVDAPTTCLADQRSPSLNATTAQSPIHSGVRAGILTQDISLSVLEDTPTAIDPGEMIINKISALITDQARIEAELTALLPQMQSQITVARTRLESHKVTALSTNKEYAMKIKQIKDDSEQRILEVKTQQEAEDLTNKEILKRRQTTLDDLQTAAHKFDEILSAQRAPKRQCRLVHTNYHVSRHQFTEPQ